MRIAIARLADRAGIHEIGVIVLEFQHQVWIDFLHAATGDEESALEMGVAEERKVRIELIADGGDVGKAHQVLILVERRAMDKIETLVAKRTARKIFQIVAIFSGEGVGGPLGGGAGSGPIGIERFEPGADFIVIPAYDRGDVGARPVDGEVGIGAVAGEVPQADDAVVLTTRIGEHGF